MLLIERNALKRRNDSGTDVDEASQASTKRQKTADHDHEHEHAYI